MGNCCTKKSGNVRPGSSDQLLHNDEDEALTRKKNVAGETSSTAVNENERGASARGRDVVSNPSNPKLNPAYPNIVLKVTPMKDQAKDKRSPGDVDYGSSYMRNKMMGQPTRADGLNEKSEKMNGQLQQRTLQLGTFTGCAVELRKSAHSFHSLSQQIRGESDTGKDSKRKKKKGPND